MSSGDNDRDLGRASLGAQLAQPRNCDRGGAGGAGLQRHAGDRMGGAGAVSDLWGRLRRSRSPRRCAPLSAAPASRPSGPSCANACASTTPVSVSVSLSKLSNSAASPSAAPTAGTCHPDAHRRLPTSSHPATVLHQRRFRNGTTTARTPRHLSCNEPRLRARSATPSSTDC